MAFRLEIKKNELPEIIEGLGGRVHRVVVEATKRTQAGISQRTPHRRVRRSLRRTTTRRADGSRGEVRGVWWWIFPEFGTRTQSATPAVTPTIEAERHRFIGDLKDAIAP